MRLLPDSIAGRIGLVLVAGVCLTLAASVAVLSPDPLGPRGSSPVHRVTERVATITSVMNRAPAADRPRLLDAVSAPGVRAGWAPDGPASAAPSRDWRARHLAKHLDRTLGPLGLGEIVVARGGAAGTGGEGASPARGDALRVWIQLEDGTWLDLLFEREAFGLSKLFRVMLAILLLTGGIAGLAVWAARRVTAPLGRFSAAAARLGTDVDAPPLDETGAGEIREAARAFNLMQSRIRRFVDDRTLMLAAVSHDLRTGLTRLKLRTEFIDDREQREKALADLDEMQAMLDSTLSFARDDSEAEPRTRVDLALLLQSLCDDLTDAGELARYEGPPRLTYACRPLALRRAFANLITNAVTYGGEALVTLREEGEHVRVSVADRGPGVPEEMRERLFAPFFRLEQSRSRETGGTGLGLAIARTVVRGHGGDITLEERPGGGLLVQVTLPREAGEARAGSA